jgi:HD superfamily phosphohydrolase
MPEWGLTKEMRESKPWGLAREQLATDKVITDPVHGDIFITKLERRVIDSPSFQRLRRVRQLGSTHLVYPGATHTRFAHSLGSVAMAQRLMDAVLDQELGPHPHQPDLFDEWREDLDYGTDRFNAGEYDRRVAEATVLARLGALLHDLTHVPFGHSLEDDLELLESHDTNISRLDRLWNQFDDDLKNDLASEGLADFLRPLIVSKAADRDELTKEIPRFQISKERAREIPHCADKQRWYDFVRDIIGNTICADLLDYLRRDHLYAGLPLAVGERYLAYFYVTPTRGEVHYPARMVLRIHRGGRERPDVVTELLKHLRYRYELSERALVHHTKLAADAMVGKALEMWSDALWRGYALEQVDEQDELKAETDIAVFKTKFGAANGKDARKDIDRRVVDEIEFQISRRGDDSLLEWLRDETEVDAAKRDSDESKDKRRAAVNTLAKELLDRRLFKRIGVQADVPISPQDFHRRYGTKERRREYEEDAADFADISHSWKVLTWIPAHTMRLKVAGVLVDDNSEIRRFVDHERRGDERGADIYRDHLHLWAVHVFVDQSVTEAQREVVLARLASRVGVRFPELAFLGSQPAEWPDMLAAVRSCKRRPDATGRARELFDYVQGQRAARGTSPPKFGLLQAEYDEAAKTLFDGGSS